MTRLVALPADHAVAADWGCCRVLPEAVVRQRRSVSGGLANALRSAEKRWWREDQDRGTLSPRTLHRICLDQPILNVFRTRAMVQGRSTAVCIVLDASGSMTTSKMVVARDSMRALLEALYDLKSPTEAFTFTTGHAIDLFHVANAMGQDPTELRQRFSRFGNLEIGLIKRFEEPVKTAMRRLPSIKGIRRPSRSVRCNSWNKPFNGNRTRRWRSCVIAAECRAAW